MSSRPVPRPPTGPQAPAGRSTAPARELRCECGSLLARIERGEIELKCRRCKRMIVMTPAALAGEILGAGAHCACSRTY